MTKATLTFLGAAGTVTGSKYLLTLDERRVLIDAGMFQGEKKWRLRNWDPFPIDPASISDLILTHAHADHSGYIPALVKAGFKGTIWCTDGTRRLAEIVLRDSAHLQEVEAQDANEGGYSKHKPALPLYTTEDVEATLPLFKVVPFDTPVDLGGGVTALFKRAGHILGSASVLVNAGESEVLFSGDLGRHDHPILRPRDEPPGAPFVLIESTYGDRQHPHPEGLEHEAMADAIRRTIARGGSVLIPAFAIDRTELVLKTLSEMRRDGRIPVCPIWVNSPMALSALDAYRALPDEIRPDIRMEDFANLEGLRESRTLDDSKKLTDPNAKIEPSIIISSSGMATGGRVVRHLAAMLPDADNSVVLTGYQGVGTRGRTLLEGATQLKMFGEYVPVNAEIVQDSEFSVHADVDDLLEWLRGLEPKPHTVFVVHGEEGSAEAFAAKVRSELGLVAVIPTYQEVVSLDAAGPAFAPRAATLAPNKAKKQKQDRTPQGKQPIAAPAVAPAAAAAASAPVASPSAPTPKPQVTVEYKLITGANDAAFNAAVSEALSQGFELYGAPTITFNGTDAFVAQAVVRRS